MGKMQQQLKRYHRQVGITPVATEKSYHARFLEFGCFHKRDCRKACRGAFGVKGRGGSFAFSPPVDGQAPTVSPHYENREYDGVPIPRIVVISLSIPQPETSGDGDGEGSEDGLTYHWIETLAMVELDSSHLRLIKRVH